MSAITQPRAGFQIRLGVSFICLSFVSLALPRADAAIELVAGKHDYKSGLWMKRPVGRTNYWGLEGNYKVESGKIGFNSFSGASGKYKVVWYVGFENDGRPSYKVSIGSKVIAQGRYPFSEGKSSCHNGGTELKPMDLGEHMVNKGDGIEIWGQSTYECDARHGAYCRWLKIVFTPVSGSPPPPNVTPTKILAPTTGINLVEGSEVTLTGEGDSLSWSYDAASDKLGSIAIGTGSQLKFTVPENVTAPRTITFTLQGDGGTVTETYNIIAPRSITITSPKGGEAWAGGSQQSITWTASGVSEAVIQYSADGGKNWAAVALSVNNQSAQWGNYSWTIPDTPTTGALIRIYEYDNLSMSAQSGTFEITSGGPTDITPPVLTTRALVIGGALDDGSITAVRIGGASFPVTGGTFMGEAMVGTQQATIAVSATDVNGGTATRTLLVN